MNDEIPFDQNLSQNLNSRKDLNGLANWIRGFPNADSEDLLDVNFDPGFHNSFQRSGLFLIHEMDKNELSVLVGLEWFRRV